jgi:hypothetical protein
MVGVAQYGMVAFSIITSGEVSLWTVESDLLESAGLLRYIKDITLVVFSIAWVIALPRLYLTKKLTKLIKLYFLWFIMLIIIGIVPFILNYSPLFFLPAGLRWLMLLHASFGIFILSSTLVTNRLGHKKLVNIILVILLMDAYAILLQFSLASNFYQMALGASRLTGLFGNAGVAGFFALSMALVILQLDGVLLKKRILINLLCIFVALSSGSRFVTMAVFLIILIQFWEVAEQGYNNRLKAIIKFCFILLSISALFFGYEALTVQVDRGDAIAQQFERGGRVYNFLETIEIIGTADVGEFVLGRGLGLGTNTAMGSLLSQGVEPNQYRFNRLVDNGLLTAFFQFGLLGSLIFWIGICMFMLSIKPKYLNRSIQRYFITILLILITILAGNPFEQYYLMVAYAVSLGSSYWNDKLASQEKMATKL